MPSQVRILFPPLNAMAGVLLRSRFEFGLWLPRAISGGSVLSLWRGWPGVFAGRPGLQLRVAGGR